VLAGLLAACAKGAPPKVAPAPNSTPPKVVQVVDTVTVNDPELEQRVGQLELQLLGKDAQLEDLQARLDEARREVVRTLAKLQTVATRAEAASAMAEAELAVQSLRNAQDAQGPPEAGQAGQLLQQSTVEFNRQNYGGALYLANQSKSVAGAGKGRLQAGDRTARPGEVPFPVPVGLVTTTRGNVRDGPGTRFTVLFTADNGANLTGYSYVEDWIRVRDESGREGWVFQALVSRRKEGTR
jgi:hypothetical protein